MERLLRAVFGEVDDEICGTVRGAISQLVIAFILIVGGSFLGAFGQAVKTTSIAVGMLIAAYCFIRFSLRRAPVGVGAGALLAGVSDPRFGIRARDALTGAGWYIRLMAAISASEIALGFIAIAIPAHEQPVAALILMNGGFALAAYAIWRKGGAVWHAVVWAVLAIGMIFALAKIVLPHAMARVIAMQPVSSLDQKLEQVAGSIAEPWQLAVVGSAFILFLLWVALKRPGSWVFLAAVVALAAASPFFGSEPGVRVSNLASYEKSACGEDFAPGTVEGYKTCVAATPLGKRVEYRFLLAKGEELGPIRLYGPLWLDPEEDNHEQPRVTMWDRGKVVADDIVAKGTLPAADVMSIRGAGRYTILTDRW